MIADRTARDSARTVVVVDDEDAVRGLASRILEKAGFRVLQASNGGDALHLLSTNSADVLVTDLRMPGLDGVDLALQAGRSGMCSRVLFITGFAAGDLAAKASRIGPVLPKPFLPADLRSAVQSLTSAPAGPAC